MGKRVDYIDDPDAPPVHSVVPSVVAIVGDEVRQQFSMAFTARLLGGESRTRSESKRVERVSPADLDRSAMHPSMKLRLQHGLEERTPPHIG